MEDGQTSGRGWMVFSLVGIAVWVGLTVRAAATLEDVSDPGPVLRTFALGGGAFFGTMFGAAAVQMRSSQTRTSHALYERLALHPISAAALRRSARGVRTIGYVYLVFGAATTGLMLAGIGFGDEALFRVLAGIVVGLLVVWVVYAGWALRRVFEVTDDLFAPLGLHVTQTPVYVSHGGGGTLTGALAYGGVRHGRAVTITQTPAEAVTTVTTGTAEADRRAPTSPQQMAALTGEPAGRWRHVSVTVDADADADADAGTVTVRRTGNGAGRWFLHDVLLAEAVASTNQRL